MNKLSKLWKNTPDFIKTGVWIGVSAGLTFVLTELLNKPELLPYYGAINFLLYGLKELDKKYRRGK